MRKNVIILLVALLVTGGLVGGGFWVASKVNTPSSTNQAEESTTEKPAPPGAPIINSDDLPKEETTTPPASTTTSRPSQRVRVPDSVENKVDDTSQEELDKIFTTMMKDKNFKNIPYLISLRDDVCSNLVDADSGAEVIESLQKHTNWDDQKVGYFIGASLSTRCPDMDSKVTN